MRTTLDKLTRFYHLDIFNSYALTLFMRFKSKQEVRKCVWRELKEKGICLFPCEGHIPNFKGVEKTISKILELEKFKEARKIFISPDTPQRYLLRFAKNKEVYMATPRLKNGFCKVKTISSNLKEALRNCEVLGWNLPEIDFALIGSVAVDLKGNRIGKGGGFGDREIEFLRKVNPEVVIATNVHDLQVFDDISYLMDPWDQNIDLIITPTKVIYVSSY